MSEKDYKEQSWSPEKVLKNREKLYHLFDNRPMPTDQLLSNLGLYMRSSSLAKILFLDEIYQKNIDIPGVVMVFGTWWGQDVITLQNLRAVYEPYNYTRKVIAFDTFSGYTSLSMDKDILSETIKQSGYSVSSNYETYLEDLAAYHEEENTMPHIKKVEIVKGDVTETIDKYLEDHPETLVSLVYFDLAIYEPTKKALEALKPYLLKGSIIAMDELNNANYPGETVAFREIFSNCEYDIYKSKFLPDRSYIKLK